MHHPAHPGEVLREWIPEGMTIEAVAQRIGVSIEDAEMILGGRLPITTEIAHRLTAWLGTSPDVWSELQAAWDVSERRQ